MISQADMDELLHGFRPLDIAAYLRLHGWAQVENSEKFSLWGKVSSEKGEFEILLPHRGDFRDIERRVFELLKTLTVEESRTSLEIIEDFTNANSDIIRARLAPAFNTNGTLPLEKGAQSFQQMRDLVLAAACAAVTPKKVFTKRKPDQAMRYLQEAKIGQTKRGSYILTVISPVPPALQSALMPEYANEPFPRKVVRTLAEALNAVEEGVRVAASSGSLDIFAEAVPRGISANLCDALLGLHEGGIEKGVEIAVSWSPTRGAPERVRDRFFLPPDSMPIINEVASYLRQTSPEEDVEIVGVVKRLERLGEESGRVAVIGSIDGESRTVMIDVHGSDHTLMIRAYEDRQVVVCHGDLIKEGKSYVLHDPHSFRVIDETSD